MNETKKTMRWLISCIGNLLFWVGIVFAGNNIGWLKLTQFHTTMILLLGLFLTTYRDAQKTYDPANQTLILKDQGSGSSAHGHGENVSKWVADYLGRPILWFGLASYLAVDQWHRLPLAQSVILATIGLFLILVLHAKPVYDPRTHYVIDTPSGEGGQNKCDETRPGSL